MRALTITEMLVLPWTWKGPTRVGDNDEGHFELRIKELPDFFLAAATEVELMRELKPALQAFLASYLERNERPPLPQTEGWRLFVPLRPRPIAAQTGQKVLLQEVA